MLQDERAALGAFQARLPGALGETEGGVPRAIIDPETCRPEACAAGTCLASKVCPVKAIWQPERGELPLVDPLRCHGCGKCLAACGLKAIELA